MSGVQTNKISGALSEAYARATGVTDNAEIVTLIVGVLVAWFKGDLFTTAVCCCGAAFLFSLIVP